MKPKRSLPRLLLPATWHNPEPARSGLCHSILLPEGPSLYYPLNYACVFQVVSFPQVSPPKPCIRLSSSPPHTCYMSCPSFFCFITQTILVEYILLSSSMCSFLHSPVTSSLLGPNTLLNTLFSNILSLRSSLNVSDQFSHPYKTTG